MPDTPFGLIAHQGEEARDVLVSFLNEVASATDWRVGATVFLPRRKPSTILEVTSELDDISDFVIADPETHRMELPYDSRGRARDDWRYLSESNPVVNRNRFVTRVLRAQVAVDRTVLVSPWLTHGTTPSNRNLRTTLAFARAADGHELVEDRTLLYGLAVTESVLASDTLRNTLIDEVVDLPQRPIYLRVLITAPRSFMQYSNEQALKGLRALVEALHANGISTVLPQMGLVGWLMLPFGCPSFGTGIAGSLQRFVPPGGFGRPLEWYFCPSFLGFVLKSEVHQLRAVTGYIDCDCPFCPQLEFAPGGEWNRRLAGRHYLWWCARLANESVDASAPSPQGIRDRIATSQEFWGEVQQEGLLLDQRSEPLHLEVWSEVVA
jgi:hypothetical protein